MQAWCVMQNYIFILMELGFKGEGAFGADFLVQTCLVWSFFEVARSVI